MLAELKKAPLKFEASYKAPPAACFAFRLRAKAFGRLTIHGETTTVTQWARNRGLPSARVFSRLRIGWPDWKALGFANSLFDDPPI